MSSAHFGSFSSAAAGKDSGNSNHPAANSSSGSGNSGGGGGGGPGSGSGDWSRRANGAASTSATRRPSLSTTLTHNNASSSVPSTSASSNVYHPPHHYNRQPAAAPATYGKDELLSLFRVQESGGSMSCKLADLVDTDLGGSTTASSGGWGRSGDEATNGVDMCWEKEGGLKPISLEDMTEEEREFFAANVNSALKVQNNANVNNTHNVQGAPNNQGTPPPNRNKAPGVGVAAGSSRPTTRRRDTSDAGLSGNPFTNATPPQVARRRTDLRGEGDEVASPVRDRTFFGRWGTNPGPGEDELEKKDDGSASGSIGRSTGLFRRGSGAAWGGTGSGSALNSPMGTFGGAFGGGPMGGFALQSGDKAKGAAPKGGPLGGSMHPKVEDVDERAEEDDRAHQPRSEGTDDGGHERPLTSDTDPFGHDGASHDEQQQQQLHSHDDRNSPLPTPGLHDQQRMKASPFGPGAGISVSTSSQPRTGSAIGTPTKQRSDLGAFGAFGGSREGLGGMGSLGMSGLHHQLQNLTFNQQGQVPLRRSREGSIGNALVGDNEPLSPAETNPFQSPPPEKVDDDAMLHDNNDGGGLGSVIAGLRKGEGHAVGAPGSDRSGRSSTAGLGSVGGNLGGFGGLSGPGLWGGGQASTPGIGSSGTPTSFFGAGLGDLSSPGGLAGAGLLSGGIGGLGGSNHFGSASRASRLGPLFPENQHHDDGQGGFDQDSFGGDTRFAAFGSRSRGFGSITDSPMKERGDVADLFGFPSTRSLSNLAAAAAAAQENPVFARDRDDPISALQQPHQQQDLPLGAGVQTPGGQPLRPPPATLPPQPQHVMIMPDKIQWVYRDPAGVVQGPFSGLEMHEWYRAGFFTPDLAVKRQEDGDFEQLGTLVRKIGNTREPFLVPLPGNSSAGMSTNAGNWSGSWLNEMPGAQPQVQQQAQQVQQQQAVQTPGGVQPPFAGSFPTFGTTLTAEQQNALERRKQEEQYLMAKQREFLLQQQMIAKQAAAAQQLHHQSSSQSLHSQPSFGSLHSPSGFVPAAAPAPVSAATIIGGQNTFEPGALLRQAGAAAGGAGGHGVDVQLAFSQQFVQPHQPQQDQQSLLMQQQQQQQQQKFAEQQRQQLQKSYQNQQSQHVEKLQQAQEQAQQVATQIQQSQAEFQEEQSVAREQNPSTPVQQGPFAESEPAALSKAKTPAPAADQFAAKSQTPMGATRKASPVPKPAHVAWGGQSAPLVQPFPPPPGPETFPTSAVAHSPSVDTPSASIAPWAKEIEIPLKGPSLKEIQELEAKQAAVREAAEAEARRHALSQQVFTQPPPPAPGLPSTAIWATSPSTAPAGGVSAWNKPLAKPAPVSSGRKTLQQIQKEEEARKAKAAAAAAAASQTAVPSNPATAAAGKRYADLASKAAAAPAQNPLTTAAWTTVGPGGKSKAPVGTPTPSAPATTTQPAKPSASVVGFASPATAAVSAVKKPTSPAAPSKTTSTAAQEEFLKWCRASIKGLNSGVTPDQVIEMVVNFPSDAEVIADTIYAVSTTMDGRRWAEEYIKRRNAAGSGVVIEAGAGGNTASSGGGWNEVAKSRPTAPAAPAAGAAPESSASFRVVAGKKKGRR